MDFIRSYPNKNGSYPPIQTTVDTKLLPNMLKWHPNLEKDTFYQYNGFVILHRHKSDSTLVSSYEPNIEAWESWKASLPPEPEPPMSDMDKLAAAYREGVESA